MVPFLLVLLIACGNECEGYSAACPANVAETCGYVWDNELWGHWDLSREDCGTAFCQEPPGPSGAAFCALDPSPDPACPDALRGRDRSARCVDGAVTRWRYGYRVGVEACGAAACVDVETPGFDPTCDDVAFCSPLEGPDPACRAGVGTTCADERTIVYCSCGFRSEAHACSSPGPTCTLLTVDGVAAAQGVCR